MSSGLSAKTARDKYREYWQDGLQAIEEIGSTLESGLARLEKGYLDFDALYLEVLQHVEALSSIYSSSNALMGKEYILRLKAMLYDYRRRYSYEGINFNALQYAVSTARELRDRSVRDYPRLEHLPRESPQTAASPYIPFGFNEARYRWVTFQRNGFWFIVPCEEADRVRSPAAELTAGSDGGLIVKIGERALAVTDLLRRTSPSGSKIPSEFLVVRRGVTTLCFAADRAGCRIGARSDLITPMLTPMKNPRVAAGSLRLFGNRHLYVIV
jgi:hypothetical protein